MRIGYDTAPMALNRAGEHRYTVGLLRALCRLEGLEVERLTPSRRTPASTLERVVYQAFTEAIYYPLAVGRSAQRAALDLVHFPRHLVTPPINLGVPTVVTLQDIIPLTHPELFSQVIARHHRWLTGPAVRRATRVIAPSEHSRREIVEHLDVDPRQVAVVPLGVEDRFQPIDPDRDLLAERFGIDRPYVLCVGTFEPRKNLRTVVAAMERIHREVPEHCLVLVGGRGWRHSEIDDVLGRTQVPLVATGFVSDADLVQLYAGADCFCYPSLVEGFGFPVAEAMRCGAPVVTSDGSSLPEVVGDAGIVVAPTSVEAVAGALAEVLRSPERRAEMRRKGLERAGRFTWERCARETVAVYREAVAAN